MSTKLFNKAADDAARLRLDVQEIHAHLISSNAVAAELFRLQVLTAVATIEHNLDTLARLCQETHREVA